MMQPRNKTLKRELAVLFSLILCWEIYINNVSMVEVIVWPVVSLIAASAGLHLYGGVQQGGGTFSTNRGRTQRSSQRTGGEDKYPNSGADK